MKSELQITTFYKFIPHTAEQVEELKTGIEAFSEKIRGLVIIGSEGFNGTLSGESEAISEFKAWLQEYAKERGAESLQFKDSSCEFHPFRLLKVKARKEIVTIGDTEIIPEVNTDASHLSPEEWDEMLACEDVVCIDTRNWYETEVGKFKGAIDPHIKDFQDFPEFLKKSEIPKDKKVLMYCTGGIRCEKAVIDARQQGYEEVYQLDGGILNYFEKRPDSQFEGECFVFDHRVAVAQDLTPSKKFKLCPHCGQPGNKAISCLRCDTESLNCERCLEKAKKFETCSKDCSYQYELHPDRKGKKQNQGYRASIQSKAK